MAGLTSIERIQIKKLFNSGGYVLDFSTQHFDDFVEESVGVRPTEKYKLSKGKSLEVFFDNANIQDSIKLLDDLLQYYKIYWTARNWNRWDEEGLHKNCLEILERYKKDNTFILSSTAQLEKKFNSDYISKQIVAMTATQKNDPTEAIGKAKELIESCCKTILSELGITSDSKWDITDLINETVKMLNLSPKVIKDTLPLSDTIKAILGNLRAIATGVATLRNAYGSGHGKGADYKGLEERHAKLAIGSAVTLVNFLWDSYELQEQKKAYN